MVEGPHGVTCFVLVMFGDDASVLLRERGLVAMGYLGGLAELACIILRPICAVVTCFDVFKEVPYWGGEQSCKIDITLVKCVDNTSDLLI